MAQHPRRLLRSRLQALDDELADPEANFGCFLGGVLKSRGPSTLSFLIGALEVGHNYSSEAEASSWKPCVTQAVRHLRSQAGLFHRKAQSIRLVQAHLAASRGLREAANCHTRHCQAQCLGLGEARNAASGS